MSISVFQEKIIKGGCGKFVLLFCGVAMVFGMAFSNCSRGEKLSATGLKGEPVKTFATVGEVEVPNSMVTEAIDRLTQQSQLSQYPPEILESLPIEYRIQSVIGGIMQTVQIAEVYEMAKRNGYKSDDDSVKKALHFTSETDFMNNILDRGKKTGELKENATIKDVEELLKPQLQGKTLKDVFLSQQTQLNDILKDPQKRLDVVLSGGQQYMMDKLTEGINPTEAEVKNSFEIYDVKRIIAKGSSTVTDAAAKAKADKAYADLKAGKSFEDVMNSSSDDIQSDPKKKKSDIVLNPGKTEVENNPDYKVLLTLQPGSFSEPQKVVEGYAIFKYLGKKIDVPKDYEANKAKHKAQYISKIVQKKFKDELDKVEKDVKPTFDSKANEAAYRYAKAMTLPDGQAKETEFKAIYDLTKAVTGSDEKPDLAATLQVITIQHIYDQPTSDKVKLKDDRIAALENYLSYNNSWSFRKEVIDAYKAKGDKTKAFEQVMAALDKNTKFDSQAQQVFSDIAAKFQEIKTAGLVSADQESQFNTKRDLWRSDKEKYDKDAAALKKQQEEDAKKAAEEAKKAKSSAPAPTPPKKAPGK